MDAEAPRLVDRRRANGMERFMIDDEFEKIAGDVRIVEEPVDPDLPPVAVVDAERDEAEPLRFRRAPADAELESGKIGAFDLR